ncbi:hypothetical protein MPER_04925, partial [Moniliophthora perniciosa FA553]
MSPVATTVVAEPPVRVIGNGNANGSAQANAQAVDKPVSYDINLPYTKATDEEKARMERGTPYPQYLPTWDPIWFDPLPPFSFEDPALRADPAMPHLLEGNPKLSEITPRMGTFIEGVDLGSLSDAAKDELALLVSQRKIVAFPAQDGFLDLGPAAQQEWMNHFGKPNYQPVSGSLKGQPGFHIIHRDGNKAELD